MSATDTRRAFRPSARRRLASTCCGIKPTLFAALALSFSAAATTPLLAQPTGSPKAPQWAKLAASPDLTIRYIYLVAEPHADASVEAKKLKNAPSELKAMVEGSGISLGPTLEAYLKVLKARGAEHHNFRIIAAGDVTADKDGTYTVNSGPNPEAPYQGEVFDSITLKRTSPTTAEVRHTGEYSWFETASDGLHRPSTGWDGNTGSARKVVVGMTYNEGIVANSEGVQFVYAYCILPGKPEQIAAAPK